MKRILLLALLACWLALPVAYGDEDVTPSSVTAGSTLDIVGPESAIQPSVDVWLTIKGLTLDEIKSARESALFDMTVFPLAGTRVHASYDWLNDTLELMFRAQLTGEYLVKLHLVRDGKLEIAAIVVAVEGDQPDPFPDPDPDPDPPGPLAKMWVIVVEESKDRTPAQAQILLDPILRKWLTANGHEIRLADRHQPAADLTEWIAQAGSALPYLFIVGPGGGVEWKGPLPTTKEDIRALCKQWGAEK